MSGDRLVALGSAIRQRRLELGLSQEELAEKAGFHRTYVGMIERGERNASYLNLIRLSAALEVSLPQLLSFLK